MGREFRQLDKRGFTKLFLSAMLDDNMGAGVQITGTTGSGKSNLMEWLSDKLVRRGMPITLIDPHGSSARKVLRMSLDWPRRHRERLLYFKPASTDAIACINPLGLTGANLSDYERLSQARVRVEQTARVIFSAFGETEFGSRPILRKWLTRWLMLLTNAGMTLSDALLLIDPHHPVYNMLLDLAPDELARHQMESLTGMKAADLEAEIGSARNRITAALEHPVAQTLFSRRDDVLDFQWLYDNDYSLIIDLDKCGILDDDTRQLICNLILNQYLATVMTVPEEQRRRRVCLIDELPVFESSSPLLLTMCTEIRKYLTKFVFLHQGSARFPGRHDNEFLNTITEMCRVHLFFRHGAGDARFFGEQVSLATWDSKRIKHIQKTPQQFTEGHEIHELVDQSEGSSEGTSTGSTIGSSDQMTETLSTATNNARRYTLQDTTNPCLTDSHGMTTSNASGTTHQESSTASQTSSRTQSRTVKQTLVPKIVTRDVVTSIQFYTPEEIDRDVASRIKEFGTGEAILQIDGLTTSLVKTPLARDVLSRTPKFAARKLREFLDLQVERFPQFAPPARLQHERQQYLDRLVVELQRLIAERRQSGIGHSPAQQLILPQDSSGSLVLEPEDVRHAPWNI